MISGCGMELIGHGSVVVIQPKPRVSMVRKKLEREVTYQGQEGLQHLGRVLMDRSTYLVDQGMTSMVMEII